MTLLRLSIFSILLSIGWYYFQAASNTNFLAIGTQLALLATVVVQGYHAYQRNFSFAHFKRPFNGAKFLIWLSIINKCVFVIFLGWAIQLAIVSALFTEAFYVKESLYYAIIAGLLFILALFARAKIDWLLNLLILISSIIVGGEVIRVYQKPALNQSVVLQAPYAHPFYILDGGNSRLNSIMKVKSRESRRDGIYLIATEHPHLPDNANDRPYPYNFGETLIAPADGTVVTIVNSFDDKAMDAIDLDGGPGNYIILKIAEERYLVLAHLRKDSFLVQEGETVKAGQPLAQAGKSGNVDLPATFLVVFNQENIFAPDTRSFPVYFENVSKSGSTKAGPYFPSRNDLFLPQKSTLID